MFHKNNAAQFGLKTKDNIKTIEARYRPQKNIFLVPGTTPHTANLRGFHTNKTILVC